LEVENTFPSPLNDDFNPHFEAAAASNNLDASSMAVEQES
jgi:hypothetical protein